jgi:serine-threonine kinase receptor-associated protein
MNQIVSRGHTRPLTEISFVQDGNERTLLVSSAHDKTPQVRNGETGDWIGTFLGHKGAVWSLKVDKLSRTLAASASGDFTAKLWCASTGKELHEFKHKHVVKSLDFAFDSQRFATGCQDGLVRIFSTVDPGGYAIEMKVSTEPGVDGINKILWSSENTIIVGKKNGKVEVWDTRTPAEAVCSVVAPGGGVTVQDLELNSAAAGPTVLVASGNMVSLFSAGDLTKIQEYVMPSPMTFKEEGGASLHPNGTRFIAGGSDLWLREFDAQSGEVLRTFKGHHGPIRCVRYHPSGNVGASGSEDATIRLWSLQDEVPST